MLFRSTGYSPANVASKCCVVGCRLAQQSGARDHDNGARGRRRCILLILMVSQSHNGRRNYLESDATNPLKTHDWECHV
jgi:hypothetical protein